MAKNKIKSGFVQIPYNVIARTTPPEERVYIVIRHFETMEKGCICSVETIGKEAGIKERQIQNILNSLENKGLIQRISRPGITTKYITIDPEEKAEAPEENTDPQTTEEMTQNPCKKLHPLPLQKNAPHPCKKLHPNNIEKNNIETEQKQNIRQNIQRAHTHTQKKKMVSFLDFCVKGKDEKKNKYTGLNIDAPENLYKAALSIGYRMTVQEVYSFIEIMERGVAIKKKDFYVVNDFETLLFSWRDNQTAEKRRQAVSEQQRLISGDEIPFMCHRKSFVRNKPFEEMKSHYLLARCAELQFNFPCQDKFWKYEILSYDEFSNSKKKKIFDALRYIPRDATPTEFLDPDSQFYWKNYIDTRGKTKKNK